MKRLTLPLSDSDIKDLKAGETVLLSGTMLTGRDAAHKRLYELVEKGEKLPIDIKGELIYYVGPAPAKPGFAVGPAGPTSSYRMDKYAPTLLDLGLKGMIGKGARNQDVIDAIVRNGCVYFACVGGAAALIAKSIKKEEILCYEDLGTEAIRRYTVENFPCIVAIDSYGNNAYTEGQKDYCREWFMLFASTVFIFVFLPVVLLLYYTVFRKWRMGQNVMLLIASLIFYAWGEPKYVLIMIASIIVNYALGLLVDKVRHRKVLSRLVIALTAVLNLSVLFIFKYLMFTVDNINSIAGLNLSVPNIALPIGISFFTFQAMSYVIDVYREKGEAQKNPLNVGLYISFFPQLIAGPIVRYETVAYQIKHRVETFDNFSTGVVRFIIGLAKKVLLANTMGVVADYSFDMPNSELTVVMAWIGAIAYSLQIFFDFSGYSDMAIGLGKMFGFDFLENFDYPYISKSITEFWRRWHMSLGTWFRDYVYFPLGGSRVKSKARLVFNLFVVWSLTGIWHGANWTFLCWGLMYFVLLVIEKLTGWEKKYPDKMIVLRRIYTLFFVLMGWVLFRADSITDAWAYICTMFGNGTLINDSTIYYAMNYFVYFLIAILVSTPIFKNFSLKIKGTNPVAYVVSSVGLLALLVVSVSYIVKGAYNPFIYFNF